MATPSSSPKEASVCSADTPPLAEPVWIAQAGEWYIVQLVEGGYALAVLESDAAAAGNDSPVWFEIQGDPVGIEGHRICP
jgi:hypothetical protein